MFNQNMITIIYSFKENIWWIIEKHKKDVSNKSEDTW